MLPVLLRVYNVQHVSSARVQKETVRNPCLVLEATIAHLALENHQKNVLQGHIIRR